MDIFIYFFVFIFGLIVGSFLNCVIYRTELQEGMPENSPQRKAFSFMRGKSFCPHCRHTLSWQDLIPLFSFLFLKGKCSYCKKPISWQYPLVELSTGFLFLLIVEFSLKNFIFFSDFQLLAVFYYFAMASFLIVIFVYDLKHYIIPDKIAYPAIAVSFLYNIFYSLFIIHDYKFFIQFLFSAIGAASFFLFIVLISRGRWMGVGDIKLAFLMGLVLGFPNILVALFSAFLIGAVIGTMLMIFGKKNLKSEIPFGPFLITGTFLGFFWGKELIDWYQGLFLL